MNVEGKIALFLAVLGIVTGVMGLIVNPVNAPFSIVAIAMGFIVIALSMWVQHREHSR